MPRPDKKDLLIKQLKSRVEQLEAQLPDLGGHYELATVKGESDGRPTSLHFNSPTMGWTLPIGGGPLAKLAVGQQVKVWFVPLES